MNYSEQRVRDRMDPNKARLWDHYRQPCPFWYDPITQTIGLGDDRVWTHVPILDPAWRMT